MDALTPLEVQKIFPELREGEQTLEQMSLTKRTELLKEAYKLVDDDKNITDQEMEVIDNIEKSVQDKIVAWGLVIKKTKDAADIRLNEVEYYKKKVMEAQDKAGIYLKKITRMSAYLRLKLLDAGIKKVDTPLVTVSLRKLPQSVKIMESADIDKPDRPEFVAESVSKRWDKKAIKAALDEGVMFKSFKLSEPDFSISIK